MITAGTFKIGGEAWVGVEKVVGVWFSGQSLEELKLVCG